VTLFDVPINATTGNLIDRLGNVQGTITYASGACVVTPVLEQIVYSQTYQYVGYVSG